MGVRRRLCVPSIRLILLVVCSTGALTGCESDPGYGGRSSAEWIGVLDSPSAADRTEAAMALGKILAIHPQSPAVIHALVAALGDSDDQVRLAAGNALAMDGVRAEAAAPGVVAALEDAAHAEVRAQAALILGAFGSVARGAVPALTKALTDPAAVVRANAAHALGQIDSGALESVPSILPLAHDPADYVRLNAVEALLNIRPGAGIAVPAFRDALRDSSFSVRAAAAYALADLGPAAAPAVPDLALRVGDREPPVRRAVAFALGQIGEETPQVVAALQAALEDPDPAVRAAVKSALDQLRSDASSHGGAQRPHADEGAR